MLHKTQSGIPDDVITARIEGLGHASLQSLSLVIKHGAPTRAVASSALSSLRTILEFTIRHKKVLARPIVSSTHRCCHTTTQYQFMRAVAHCLRLLLLETSQASRTLCIDRAAIIFEMLDCVNATKGPAAIALKETLLRAISRVLRSTPPDSTYMRRLLLCMGENVSDSFYSDNIFTHWCYSHHIYSETIPRRWR